AAVVAGAPPVLPDVGDMQERRAIEADVDERRLHPGQHAPDLAEVDVPDEPAGRRPLDMQFLRDALLEHGDARFLRGNVDQYFFAHSNTSPAPCNRFAVSNSG